jgi:hypothetical protein
VDGVDDVVKQLEIEPAEVASKTRGESPPFSRYEVMLAAIAAIMGIVAVIAGLAASL